MDQQPQLGRGVEKFGDEQVTLNLGQLINRVDTNVNQDIIVTTADKAKLCLIDALDRLERRRSWIAPAGIVATLFIVFPTTTFHDFIGLSKEYWKAMFSLVTLGSLFWLIWTLFRLRSSLSVDQVVENLRASSITKITSD
ncbi:MAG TPA: hypothetical protein VKU19_29580 [Bryobacteraceae bacterium]|nr:hypothetical protein [Bryobacteraceae bacterium]